MKRCLLYLLIPIMLLQSNMTLLICTSFYYNQNYIEKYLCVQRSIVNNTCHGQCFLMKKIKAQQEKEQSNFKVNFNESNAIATFDFDFTSLCQPLCSDIIYSIYTTDLRPKDYNASVFRPPVLG